MVMPRFRLMWMDLAYNSETGILEGCRIIGGLDYLECWRAEVE